MIVSDRSGLRFNGNAVLESMYINPLKKTMVYML